MKGKKGLILGGILLLGIGFAAVSTTLYINGNINISANTEDFDVKFTKAVIDNEDKTSESISVDGKTINFTTKELQALNDKSILDFEVTNNSSVYDAEVSIECTSGEKGDYYQIIKEVANIIPAKTTGKGKVEVQKIKVTTEDIEEAFTCTLTATAKERTIDKNNEANANIKVAYAYNDESCITGEEESCTITDCYKDASSDACSPGTIIKYNVDGNDVKYFHVLHDNGDTMILQQRENIASSSTWYTESEDNTKGPLTALEILENKTLGWTNVNTISYTMGTTSFIGNNAYTGCNDYSSCVKNSYVLPLRSGKARMLTIQESASLGCTGTPETCPIWLYNYLKDSINFGGTNNGIDTGYWLLSASSNNLTEAWNLDRNGRLFPTRTTNVAPGLRAVVEINKYV